MAEDAHATRAARWVALVTPALTGVALCGGVHARFQGERLYLTFIDGSVARCRAEMAVHADPRKSGPYLYWEHDGEEGYDGGDGR